ncbi:unnamed protein product [Protopolystoma xenopodis]|uniref:Hexosyltransferase n=1 Tax=Protopolystoma xenopodis TaxID=117903 RepID=A0A448XHU9_9PLAT|nr:unnamed protein product [Protopolystoma xenopodis]
MMISEFPIVFLAIFVEVPTPFLDVFFQRIASLTYPKSRIHLLVHFNEDANFQHGILEHFNSTHGLRYKMTTEVFANTEVEARSTALSACSANVECEFIFMIDGVAQLTKKDTLEHLVTTNRNFVAPLLRRRGKLWSNFWGALNKDGYYARSDDYVDLVESERM